MTTKQIQRLEEKLSHIHAQARMIVETQTEMHDGHRELVQMIVDATQEWAEWTPSKAPHRRYEMEFRIGADTYKELLGSLDQWVGQMEREHPDLEENWHGVSGGYGSGYSFDIAFDSEMDHETWYAQLREYLDKGKEAG